MIDNIEQEAQKIREDLRNERRANSEQSHTTGESPVRHGGSTNEPHGPSVQVDGRPNHEIRSTSGKTDSSDKRDASVKRSSQEEPVGFRQGARRRGSSDTGIADNSEATSRNSSTIIGSLEKAPENIPFRQEEEKKKETPAKIVSKLVKSLPSNLDELPFLPSPKTKTLSKKEVEELHEPLKQAISDYGDYIDIYWQRIEPDAPSIWGNFTEKELEIVTRALLRKAQTHAGAAHFSRLMIDGQDYIAAFVILVPRIVETMKFVGRQVSKKKKIA